MVVGTTPLGVSLLINVELRGKKRRAARLERKRLTPDFKVISHLVTFEVRSKVIFFAKIDVRLSFKGRYQQNQESYQYETLTGVFFVQVYTKLIVFIFFKEYYKHFIVFMEGRHHRSSPQGHRFSPTGGQGVAPPRAPASAPSGTLAYVRSV